MNKEKEIEEMASIIYSKLNTGTYDNAFDDVGDAVVALQEAGYRKADEVRKETAKEILQVLFDNHFEKVNDYKNRRVGYSVHDFYCEIKRLAKQYGVEVDE